MSEWQPIETAPEGGTSILAWGVGPADPNTVVFDYAKQGLVQTVRVMVWSAGYAVSEYDEQPDGRFVKRASLIHRGWQAVGGFLFTPTHWMPLPDPPSPNSVDSPR